MTGAHKIIVATDAGISIRSFEDISDAIAVCFGSAGLILTEKDLATEFFDLRSGLAGELFQKFMNYKLRLAIVVPHVETYGERFSELACEHASHGMIRVVPNEAEAKAWLSS